MREYFDEQSGILHVVDDDVDFPAEGMLEVIPLDQRELNEDDIPPPPPLLERQNAGVDELKRYFHTEKREIYRMKEQDATDRCLKEIVGEKYHARQPNPGM